jgi:hypothetical protein
VAGSVAETLGELKQDNIFGDAQISTAFFDAIKAFLLKKVKTIGGSQNETAVRDAINDAYALGPNIRFEDGTIDANALTSDYPLTDFRPF